MRNENQPSTDIDSMGRLALAVAKASELCHPSARKTLLEACDALEEEFDALKAERDALNAKLDKRDWQVISLKSERDAMAARLHDLELQYAGDCYDELWKKHEALKAERDILQKRVDSNLSRILVSREAQGLTVVEQITNWAEANYNESHEASAVVEGCYDDAELEAFGSLAAFKEHAGIRDDYRADIIAMGGE